MGKEAKLGVAVIALLLLTLGAVATWRLIRADEQANPDSAAVEEAADADREGASPTVDDAGQPEDPQPEAERRQSAAALLRRAAGANTDSRKPTVLSPQAGAAEQETADFDAAKWEDLAEARTADAAGVPPDVPAQRSYMPSTESPTVAEPHEQYGQAVADDSSGAEQGESRYGRYHRSTDPFPQRPRDSGGESREETETIQPTPPVPDETTENNFSYRERRRSLDQGQPNDRPSNRWSTGHSADAPPDKAAAQSSPVQSSSATARIHVASSGRGERSPDGTYEVQPNDNFWKISEKLYGTGGYFKALVAHNRDRVERPDRLQVGQVLDAPDVAELEADHPDLCPKPEHRYV
ncbi:MAG: LysM peptidoglycan-binding domain-containing protein, partial [Planctomycetota bacterium]